MSLLNDITARQKLTIGKCLLDYQFITDHWKSNSQDFKEIYYEFYLKARWAVMANGDNREVYFDMLQHTAATADLMDVVDNFKTKTGLKSNEFSICSKLLHTVNPSSPIYDSKVREYLSRYEGVEFVFNSSKAYNMSSREKIKHDWEKLCEWYDSFLGSSRGKEWIEWFDCNYPSFRHISDVKKVDCIIFAAN